MIDHFLLLASVVLGLIVVIGFVNEKTLKLTYEIALLLFSVIVGAAIVAVVASIRDQSVRTLLANIQVFDLKRFLMEGVLCFMLFAGSRNLKLSAFRENARKISVLAFLCTFLGAVFYGLLFYGVSALLGLGFTFPICLMLGSIIAPTDPIAATSILKKFGLPKEVGFLMEAESLLNDGVGVALFVCFSGIVSASGGESFFTVLVREIFGAILIGTIVSMICCKLIFSTDNPHLGIFASLLSVSLSFFLCETLECSGAIACVTCGLVFSTYRDKAERENKCHSLEEFDSFWETADVLLNSILYVILGLTFARILQMQNVFTISFLAILLNFIARYVSVFIGTLMLGELPDGYNKNKFSLLFTWGGLRGGLSIALAMSTASMVSRDTYFIIVGSAYAIVFFTTVIQGLTMQKVYQGISK